MSKRRKIPPRGPPSTLKLDVCQKVAVDPITNTMINTTTTNVADWTILYTILGESAQQEGFKSNAGRREPENTKNRARNISRISRDGPRGNKDPLIYVQRTQCDYHGIHPEQVTELEMPWSEVVRLSETCTILSGRKPLVPGDFCIMESNCGNDGKK